MVFQDYVFNVLKRIGATLTHILAFILSILCFLLSPARNYVLELVNLLNKLIIMGSNRKPTQDCPHPRKGPSDSRAGNRATYVFV